MIFNSIYLEESDNKRLIEFSKKNNLIYSQSNSKGKSTLLRLLLYSIGYNIPNTKNIKFENCLVKTTITTNQKETIVLIRDTRESIIVEKGKDKTTYILPSQETDLHKIIFNGENIELLNNILGAFYFDQEKGWTLLNRGVVIGNIRFNIEALIRGLANIDCTSLIQEKERKKRDLLKYKQMFSVSKYQEALDIESNDLATKPYDTVIESQINQYRIQLNLLKKDLSRIDKVLNDNKKFRTFISKIGLLVRTPSGDDIAVDENNIVGLNDAIDFLIAKKRIITSEYNKISSEINKVEKQKRIEDQQLSFFNDQETISEIFDKTIASIPINEIVVKEKIQNLDKEISDINSRIRELTKTKGCSVITSIYNKTRDYLKELGFDVNSLTNNFIFTSNLKELSGAILHKTVFALRLACLLEIEKHLSIKIPIILDSPSGKEIDHQNMEKMIGILNRDFSDNQIIIASIFEYEINNPTRIDIINRLIES